MSSSVGEGQSNNNSSSSNNTVVVVNEQLNKKIGEFLKNDKNNFADDTFDSTRYLVQLLTDQDSKKQLLELFDGYVEQENKCEEILTEGIDYYHNQFNQLMTKPTYYGQQYEAMRQLTSQSRRSIVKSKELLQKKQLDAKLYYHNQIYVRGINSTLEKVEGFQARILAIENCLRSDQFYEASVNLREAREIVYNFSADQTSTVLVKHMREQEKQKTEEVYKLLQRKLAYYSFFYEQRTEILTVSQTEEQLSGMNISYQSLETQQQQQSSQSQLVNFAMERIALKEADMKVEMESSKDFEIFLKDQFGVDLAKYAAFKRKLQAISDTISEPVIDLDANPQSFFSQLSHQALSTYIRDFCMNTDDFDKVCAVWDEIGEDRDLLSPSCERNDMIGLLMLLHSSSLIQKNSQLLTHYFKAFNEDLNTTFWLIQFFFIGKLIDEKKPNFKFNSKGEELFERANFIDPYNIEVIHDFVKTILCFCAIMIKKQLVLRKAISKLDIVIEDSTNVRSISHITSILASQLETIIHAFIFRPFDTNIDEYKNENTRLHLFMQEQIKDAVRPSLVGLPFLVDMIHDVFAIISGKLKSTDQTASINASQNQQEEESLKLLVATLLQCDMDKFYQFCQRLHGECIKEVFLKGDTAGEVGKKINPNLLQIELAQNYIERVNNESSKPSNATGSINNSSSGKVKKYEQIIQKLVNPHEESLKSLYTSAKYLFPQIPVCLKSVNHWLCIYKIAPNNMKLDITQALNIMNYQLNIITKQCSSKLKQIFQNTYVDILFGSTGKDKILKTNPGFIKWSNKKFFRLKIATQNQAASQLSSQLENQYHHNLKESYSEYFSKSANIEEDYLFSKSGDVSYAATLMITLELYLNQINKFFEDFVEIADISTLEELLGNAEETANNRFSFRSVSPLIRQPAGAPTKPRSSSASSSNSTTLPAKLSLLLDYNTQRDSQGFKVEMYADLDMLAVKFDNENLKLAIPRFIKYMKSLLETAEKCFLSLKLELHLKFFAYIMKTSKNMNLIQRARSFSSTNVSDFYQELYRFYSTIALILPEDTLDLLFDDFAWMMKRCFKENFKADKEFKFTKTQTLVKDVKILVAELLKIPQLQKNSKILVNAMLELQSFFSLNMVEEHELLDFLKQNTYKYSLEDIQEYFDIRPVTNNGNTNNTLPTQVLMRQALLKDATKYLLQKNQQPTVPGQGIAK